MKVRPSNVRYVTIVFHTICGNIPDEVYFYVNEACNQLSWNWSHCNRGSVKLNRRLVKMESLSLEQEARHDELVANVTEMTDVVDSEYQESVEFDSRLGNLKARLLTQETNMTTINMSNLSETYKELNGIK